METREETCRMEIRILSNMRFGSCWKMHLEDVVLQMDRHSLAESRLGSSARTIRCSIYRSQIKSVSRHKHPLERERDIQLVSNIFFQHLITSKPEAANTRRSADLKI